MDNFTPDPVEEYVLQDMFEWLTSPAREIHEFRQGN
jgi:hypothetical protein